MAFIKTNRDLVNNAGGNGGNGSGLFVKLNDGETMLLRPIVQEEEFVSYYKHTIKNGAKFTSMNCSEECVLCARGERRSLRTIIPVMTEEGMKIWDCSVNDMKEYYSNKEEYGEPSEMVWKLKREGTGKDTKYKLFPQLKVKVEGFGSGEAKVPDYDKIVKFPTKAEQLAKLGEAPAEDVKPVDKQGVDDSDIPF